MAKVLGWLVLHLAVLGLAFFLFVRWQLGLGLDSLLSGSAGERLAAFGDEVRERIQTADVREWNETIGSLGRERQVTAALFDPAGNAFPLPVPPDVIERARSSLPPRRMEPGPPPMGPGPRPRPGMGAPPPRPPDPGDVTVPLSLPKSRPVFLTRGSDGGYWAGVMLHLPPARGMPDRARLLLVQADRLDGAGMFFDFKPWLWGGIAVLLLSLAFWTPFVWGITRYLHRLTLAAGEIAAGRFRVSLPSRSSDELAELGRAVESMADRLDHLVSGQKRFLGDAAHELCAPLARIRTALGVLDGRMDGNGSALLASIEADAAELASLVDEILAFSRAGNRQPAMQSMELLPLIQGVLARESAGISSEVNVPHGLHVTADPRLLDRALGNLIRNAAVHAGPAANVTIAAKDGPETVEIEVTDNGPGVPPGELSRIFEPFHRLDPARSRETGGSGLGLAIVRSAIQTCGGEVTASLPKGGGLRISISLPKLPGKKNAGHPAG